MSDTVWLGLMFMLFSGVCNVINLIFSLFLKVANISTTIISIDKIMNNIYLIISIVMVFYATISFMTYLISPDKITDKTSGGGKLIIKIVITLALLVLTPTLFSLSRDLQSAILHENILGKIILSSNETFDDEKFSSAGHEINKALVKAFIVPQTENAKVAFSDEGDPFFSMNATSMSGLKSLAENSGETDFNFVMAIVSAVILCLILFGFLFDVAIRVVKLLFMELIAPLPILTYPFSKGNNNTFSKWVKETLSTYASVFIRLALIYFVLYCLNALTTSKVFEEDPVTFAFIILGALLFAKQLPKLLQEILGIKTDGNFTLNPMKRIREVPVLGSAVQTAGAAAGGFLQGTSLGFKAAGGFKGIGEAFKENGFKGGMKKIGSTALKTTSTSLMGGVYGGRAGFKQTKFLGVAAKDQKIDKNAYRTGASTVAQAITGNSDASAGFPDRMFNRIGTQLNKPAYEMQKAIDDADKEIDKANELLAAYLDSKREIYSNMGASTARKNNLELQLNTIDQNILNIESTRDQRITDGTTQLNNAIQSLEDGRLDAISSRTSEIDSQLVTARAEYERIQNTTRDIPTMARYQQQIRNLENQRVQVENDVNNEIDQQITELTTQRTNISQTVDNQIAQETSTLRNERTTVERQFSEAKAVADDYTRQYNEIRDLVGYEKGMTDDNGNVVEESTGQYKVVADAKSAKKKAKDELKSFLGDYKKNK